MKTILLLCMLAMAGCGFYNEALHTPGSQASPFRAGQTLGFEVVRTILGRNRCLECHNSGAGNGVVLTTYASAKALAARIYATTSSGAMPKGGPRVVEGDVAVLKAWLDAGAPETSDIPLNGGGGVAPVPAPVPGPPGALDFTAVKAAIFVPHCVGCHSAFNDYARVASNLQGIQRAIDTNFMPRGGPPLNAELKTMLANWIAAGAPDGPGGGGGGDDCDDDPRHGQDDCD